jgi:hypothetical protein
MLLVKQHINKFLVEVVCPNLSFLGLNQYRVHQLAVTVVYDFIYFKHLDII